MFDSSSSDGASLWQEGISSFNNLSCLSFVGNTMPTQGNLRTEGGMMKLACRKTVLEKQRPAHVNTGSTGVFVHINILDIFSPFLCICYVVLGGCYAVAQQHIKNIEMVVSVLYKCPKK